MKTNYLSVLAIIGLLAFSSCSKDDATTDNKTTTTEEKSTIVLDEEQTVTASNDMAQNINQIGEFDNLLGSSTLLKGMATTAKGPNICGQIPEGKLNPATASYDFKYDFGTTGDCTLNDVSIKGKLTISVDAKKNITILFENFVRKDTQANQILETTYNGTIKAPVSTIADQRSYTANLTTTTTRTNNTTTTPLVVNFPRVFITISCEFTPSPSLGILHKTIRFLSDPRYRISSIGGIAGGGISKGLSTVNGIANFTVSANGLVFDNSCKQKLIGGSLQITDATLPKNNTKVLFSACANKKWTIQNDGKEYFITF